MKSLEGAIKVKLTNPVFIATSFFFLIISMERMEGSISEDVTIKSVSQ